MEEVNIKNVLKYIQYVLRVNNIRMSEEQIYDANQYILPFLKNEDLFSDKKHKIPYLKDEKMAIFEKKKLFSLIHRYYSYHQNTLSLYEKLKDKNYPFGFSEGNCHFYALNQQLSSKFGEEEYIQLLLNHDDVVRRFYYSFLDLSSEEKEEVAFDFSEILRKSPSILHVTDKESIQANLLTARNIRYFGKDFLIHSTQSQRNFLNTITYKIHSDDANHIKELLEKYPGYHGKLLLNGHTFENFSLDEIGTMSRKDEHLYTLSLKNHVFDRMKQLLDEDVSFNCPDSFIRYEIFQAIDNETILGLTDEGKMELANLKIKQIDNVWVIPIRQIHKILFRDKLRKNKESLVQKIHR